MEVTASPLLDAVVDRGAPHAVYTSVAALRTMHQRAPPLPRACRSRLSFPATSHTVPLCTCIPHDLVFTLTPQPSLRARHSSPDCRREHPGLYRTLLVNRTDARVPSVPPRRVPLRARHIPTTTSGQLPPGLLRPRRRLLSGGPGPADLNAALDVCFDPLFSCSHMQVQPAMCGRGCGGKDGDV